MFKGVGRQVVVLKNTDSKIFEEAIFIIRDGVKCNKPDMLAECERIIRDNYTGSLSSPNKKRNKRKAMIYTAIILAALLTGAVIYIIISL